MLPYVSDTHNGSAEAIAVRLMAENTPGNERPGSAGSKGGGSRPGSASKTMRPGTPQKDDNVFVATEPRRRSLRAAGSAAKLGAGLASSKIVNIAAVEGEELPPPPFVDTPPPEEKKKKRTVVTGIPRLMPEDSGLDPGVPVLHLPLLSLLPLHGGHHQATPRVYRHRKIWYRNC